MDRQGFVGNATALDDVVDEEVDVVAEELGT